MTSQVGWATQKNKKKKSHLKLPYPNLPSPPLSSSFPSLFLVSPILCAKLKASVSRAQTVEVAGHSTMPQSESQDS